MFDFLSTQSGLEPAVEMPWPPHVKYARFRVDIQLVKDDDRWYVRISVSSMESIGITTMAISKEQGLLLAERMARSLKADTDEPMKSLFHIDREVDLADDVSEFVLSLSMMLHREEYGDLGEFEALLGASLDHISSCIPSAKTSGSPLGIALVSFPRGKAIRDAAQLDLLKARTTMRSNHDFMDTFDELACMIPESFAVLTTSKKVPSWTSQCPFYMEAII